VKWSSAKIAVNDLNINFYRSGEGRVPDAGPPVILAHGITDSGQCWDRVAEWLAESYDILSLDARGHGFSDKPERGYGPREHATDLIGLIEAQKLNNPVLIGHSMGADNAAMLTHMKPDIPCCLVLEDPPWLTADNQPTPQEAEKEAEEWRDEIRNYQKHAREELMAIAPEIRLDWPDSEYGPWVDAKLRVDLRVLDFLTSRVPWSKMVPSIRCPTLLVTADPGKGAIVTPELAEEISGMNNNFEIVRIEGSGHNIRREQFEKYTEVVGEFLQRNSSV
jgi:N-formylmaleamate deformylase